MSDSDTSNLKISLDSLDETQDISTDISSSCVDIPRQILSISDDDPTSEKEKDMLILSFLEIICSPQHLPLGAKPNAYHEIVSQLQDKGIISNQCMETSQTAIKNIYHKLITKYNIPFQYLLQHNELVSTRYLNEFQEKELLGSGGYGNVYLAYHKIDDHDYAIKKIPLSQYENLGPQILREVRSLAKFNHPNIVRYFSSWIEYDLLSTSEEETITPDISELKTESLMLNNNKAIILNDIRTPSPELPSPELTLFIQLELCQQTLQQYITRRNDTMDELTEVEYKNAIYIFQQIVMGIKYIHDMKYIHRDLKPANIFINNLNNKLQVKIGDFGLVRQTPYSKWDSWTSTSDIIPDVTFPLTTDIGTTIYAAPEQINNIERKVKNKKEKNTLIGYNQKSDMYSLGIIFWELLSICKTQMERHIKIKNLKNGKIDDILLKKYSTECKIILKLTHNNPIHRMSLSELIPSS